MKTSERQAKCESCKLRLVWKFSEFGRVSDMKCPFCNGQIWLTTYYLMKYPTLYLKKPIQIGDSNYKCPHKDCDFECGFDGVIGHQVEHKGINKDSPYYKENERLIQ